MASRAAAVTVSAAVVVLAAGLLGVAAPGGPAAVPTAVGDDPARVPQVAFTDTATELAELVVSSTLWIVYGEVTRLPSPGVEREASTPWIDAGESKYAFVSTRGAAAPAAGSQPDVDVYVRWTRDPGPTAPGSDPELVRVTCDAAAESHPVVSPDGTRVAYATDAGGRWEIRIARLPVNAEDSRECLPVVHTVDHVADADDLWPSWAGPTRLVFSSTRDDPLGDLYSVQVPDRDGVLTPPGGGPVRLTDAPSADTQPDARATESGLMVLFTTTRYLAEGSIAVLVRNEVDLSGAPTEDPAVGVYNPYDGYSSGTSAGCEASWQVPLGAEPGGEVEQARFAYTSPGRAVHGPATVISVAAVSTPYVFPGGPLPGQDAGPAPPAVLNDDALVPAADAGRAASHPSWALDSIDGGPMTTLRYTVERDERDLGAAAATDGSGRRLLTDPVESRFTDAASPSWSPDGRRVVFTARATSTTEDHEAGDGVLYVLDVATGEVAPLPVDREPGDQDADPAWSPDGTRIAFARDRNGVDGRVLVVEVDGSTAPDDLSTRAAADLPGQLPGAILTPDDAQPAWSPDGTRLAMVSSATADGSDGTPLPRRVVVVDVETAALWSLTWPVPTAPTSALLPPTGEGLTDGFVDGADPAWSPDGTRLAVAGMVTFSSEDGTAGAENAGAVTMLTLGEPTDEGTLPVTEMTALTGFELADPAEEPAARVATPSRAAIASSRQPAWSPDGTEVAFTGRPAGRADGGGIYAVRVDGTGLRTIAAGVGAQGEPDFQWYANLATTLTGPPERVDVGETTTVTASVSNTGPAEATPTVTVTLPPGVVPGAMPAGCSASPQGTVVVCTPSEPLPPGETSVFPIPVRVTAPGPHTVVVTTTSSRLDPDPADDTTTVVIETPDGPAGNVTVTVTLTAPTAWVGGRAVRARIVVRNEGPGPARDVTVTTAFPDAVVPAPADPVDTRTCVAGSGTCALGQVRAGAEVVLTVVLSPAGPADVRAARGVAEAAGTVPTPTQPARWTGLVAVSASTSSAQTTTADDAATAPLDVVQPWVHVLPAVARPGRVVLAYAEDLPPGERVTAVWDRGITAQPGAVEVAADGRLSMPVPVVPNDLLGTRTLVLASADATDPAFASVGAALLVNPAPVDAPDFILRR